MRSLSKLMVVSAALLSAACSPKGKTAAVAPPPGPRGGTQTRPPTAPRDTVTVADPAQAARIGRLEVRLLERDAQIEELQTRLDETRREFVRTLARLQTSTNRAEAASGMAEAEVALQSLRAASGGEQSAGVAQVSQLVQEGAAEFNKQNFGGALYLATQAKMLAATYRTRPGDGRSANLRAGETTFAIHVPLRATSRANVREGPGTNFAIAFSVDDGEVLIGHSYVDEWIRVSDVTGRSGWIFRTLVAKR